MSEYLIVDLGEDAKRERKYFRNMPTLFKWIDERLGCCHCILSSIHLKSIYVSEIFPY